MDSPKEPYQNGDFQKPRHNIAQMEEVDNIDSDQCHGDQC